MTIPGHTMGNIAISCQRCYYFQFPRANLHEYDQGLDILGQCGLFNDYTTAYMLCPQREEGEPDAN